MARLVCVSFVALATQLACMAGAAAAGSPRPTTRDLAAAARVAHAFIATAVVRRQTSRSFDLVTPEFRQGLTRRQWAGGNIPVVPVAQPVVTTARLVIREPHRVSWLMMIGRYGFELELVERGGWRVSYFAPAVAAAWTSGELATRGEQQATMPILLAARQRKK
jgi:hypothetical protein